MTLPFLCTVCKVKVSIQLRLTEANWNIVKRQVLLGKLACRQLYRVYSNYLTYIWQDLLFAKNTRNIILIIILHWQFKTVHILVYSVRLVCWKKQQTTMMHAVNLTTSQTITIFQLDNTAYIKGQEAWHYTI